MSLNTYLMIKGKIIIFDVPFNICRRNNKVYDIIKVGKVKESKWK